MGGPEISTSEPPPRWAVRDPKRIQRAPKLAKRLRRGCRKVLRKGAQLWPKVRSNLASIGQHWPQLGQTWGKIGPQNMTAAVHTQLPRKPCPERACPPARGGRRRRRVGICRETAASAAVWAEPLCMRRVGTHSAVGVCWWPWPGAAPQRVSRVLLCEVGAGTSAGSAAAI